MRNALFVQRMDRRGSMLAWSVVAMVFLLAAASFGLDWARVALVRSQMQGASDAAARAAAAALKPGQNSQSHLDLATLRAQQVVGKTDIGGRSLGAGAVAIEFGKWGSPASGFNVLTGSSRSQADSIRVIVSDTTPLTITSFFKRSDFTQSTKATAQASPSMSIYGVIGLDSVNLNSAALCIDSYDSDTGPYSAGSARDNVIVASNGNWNLQNHARVDGDVHYWSSNIPVGGKISGERAPMPEKLVYQPSTVPPGAIEMGHYNGDRDLVLAAGDYHFPSFNLTGNRTITTQGKVRIFVSGNVNLTGNTIVSGDKPGNLEIHTTTASGVNLDFKGTTQVYAVIYAPNSPININGTGDLYGSVIGKSLSMSGNSKIHYDETIAKGKIGRIRLME